MFLEKLKENKSYSKMMALLPMHAHAASAVKTRKVKMRVGQSIQLQLKGVTEPLKWKSLNRKKLSVDSNGLITAKRKGTATIRVRYNGVKYKFIVTIRKRKKNQSTNIRTVTMKLKKSATSAATTDETPDDEEELTTAKYAGLKTTATGSFPQNKIIMVGDSRFVGMSASVSNSSTWLAKVSMGLSWLKETAAPKLLKRKKSNIDGWAVVFNLGVNDLGNVNNYISYMNALGEQLREKGATVYFMTVNPIDDKTAKKKGIKIVYLKKDSSFRIGDVKAKVLWGTDYKNKEHDKKYINNNSLVTKFISEDMTYLNAGDIEREAERQILKAKVNLRADVFKMNHHGVDTSNTDAFLKAVGASYYYYNYRLDNTKRFSPSGTWAYRPVTDAQKYGNVTSLMYNGGREKTRTITYSVKNGVLTQDIRSNISRKKVYLYDRKKETKLKKIVTLEVCNVAEYKLKTRMFRGYRYSKTKKTIKNNTASVKSTKKVSGNAVKTKCGLRRAASWKLNKKIKITKYIAEKTAEKRSRIPQRAKNA